jgi:dsRNA-specific ribonuclease
MLRSVFEKGAIKPHYIDELLKHLDEYKVAFTTELASPTRNLEVYEAVGDGIGNAFISFYALRRFPQLNCAHGVKYLARLKINYGSRNALASVATKLGFWPHIVATDSEKQFQSEKILEDVMEAFVGLTTLLLDKKYEIGVGYGIVYQIFKAIYDEMDISLEYESLYDPKYRLKELFDAYQKQLGRVEYKDDRTKTTIYRLFNGQKIVIGEGVGKNLSIREQSAAKQALERLGSEGFKRKQQSILICE